MERIRRQPSKTADQPPRDADADAGATTTMRTELFQVLAFRSRRNHLPDAARNPCRKDPRLLSAQQGARHLRPRDVRDTAVRSAAHPPTRGAKALAGGRYLRSRAPHEEI